MHRPPARPRDHHDDNPNPAGRALLPQAGRIVTTAPGAQRLGGGATGLCDWESTRLQAPGKPAIEVTATPCRHGPPGFRPLVGAVIGFALAIEGASGGVLWISGDTVLYDGVLEVTRLDIDVAVIHLGGVQFPVTGPLRYTLTASQAVKLCEATSPRVIVPIHYEGWKHFREGRAQAERAFAAAPPAVAGAVRWLPIGEPQVIPG